MSLLRRPGEKTYTQRCRLFVGNLPADITEEEFKRLFAKYGEPGEVFINKGKGFGFIKLVSFILCIIKRVLFVATDILVFKQTRISKSLNFLSLQKRCDCCIVVHNWY